MGYTTLTFKVIFLPVWVQTGDLGTKMIMHELSVDYETAKELLLRHGSVSKAVDAERNKG